MKIVHLSFPKRLFLNDAECFWYWCPVISFQSTFFAEILLLHTYYIMKTQYPLCSIQNKAHTALQCYKVLSWLNVSHMTFILSSILMVALYRKKKCRPFCLSHRLWPWWRGQIHPHWVQSTLWCGTGGGRGCLLLLLVEQDGFVVHQGQWVPCLTEGWGSNTRGAVSSML